MADLLFVTFWSAIMAALLNTVASDVFYVTTNNHTDDSNNNTLKHYLDNPKKYFKSDSQLKFFPGEHQLDVDMVFENIKNFTMTAITPCKIYCSFNVGIVMVNVTEFELQNISLVNCGKNHTIFIYLKRQEYSTDEINPVMTNKTNSAHYNYNSSVLLYHCTLVSMINVNMSVGPYFGGVITMNVKKLMMIDVKVQLECPDNCKFDHPIYGILLYYNNRGRIKKIANVTLHSFSYKVNGSCRHFSRYAITVLLLQNKYNVSVTIEDIKFNSLNYSSVLFFYMLSCKLQAQNSVYIKNSAISNNIGDSSHMFYIKLYKPVCTKSIDHKDKATKYSLLYFLNCKFMNNTNMQAMIYIMPATVAAYAGRISIRNTHFVKNRDVHFIEVKGKTEIVPWQLSTYIYLNSVNVSLNEHYDGSNLISITNSMMYLVGNSTFMNNSYYDSILMLHLSTVICNGSTEVTYNRVRQIMKTTSGSYFMMNVSSSLSIINNTVHSIAKQVFIYENAVRSVCPIQFYHSNYKYDYHPDKINIHVYMLNNIHTISKGLTNRNLLASNCSWLAGSSFQNIDAELVYEMVFQIKHIIVNRNSTRTIPLSVCPCSDTYIDCYSPNLNSIYPGQTLHISLIVRNENLRQRSPSTTLVVANTPLDSCTVSDSYQLSQTHFSHGCNNYSYTIWPSHKNVTECELFIGLMKMPEMFFIKIKHCPKGFTLQTSKKSCDCDTALNNIYFTITSCDLDDQTIVRPANSWISSDTFNGSYTYIISPHCPFLYCLPYSSNLLLATPDMQCQHKRSGTLCGRCQQGLSTVFGSSRCRQCSNLYFFIVVPIAIAGILIVMALFIFNITVSSGSFNTYIFFVNMISINYYNFCPNSHSFECTVLSLFNLDLGIETCFYDGMDDYSKIWLHLTFPFYLIIIAITLIIGSRYCTKIQRLTAHRSLQVLATLFLLSYTKLLLAVCQVLFAFSSIMHLPSQRIETVWSVDASVKIFGIKFCFLFFVCLIIFLILLLCNTTLLFPRTVLRIKFVNKFKPLFDPYFAPYKDKFSFWTGLQLLARAVFFALTARLNISIGITLLIILLCLQGITQPFKSYFKNIQESLMLSNLLIVYTTIAFNNDGNTYTLVKLLVNASLSYFIVYIICHSVMTLCGEAVKQRYDQVFNFFTRRHYKSVKHLEKSYNCEIPEVTYNYQEFQDPLIGLDN